MLPPDLNTKLKGLVWVLLASICCNYDYLIETLQPQNFFLYCLFFEYFQEYKIIITNEVHMEL